MKDFIISTLDLLLDLFVVFATIGGLILGGRSNLFGNFDFMRALAGGLIGFCLAAIFTGSVFTLLRIKELLEEQLIYLKREED